MSKFISFCETILSDFNQAQPKEKLSILADVAAVVAIPSAVLSFVLQNLNIFKWGLCLFIFFCVIALLANLHALFKDRYQATIMEAPDSALNFLNNSFHWRDTALKVLGTNQTEDFARIYQEEVDNVSGKDRIKKITSIDTRLYIIFYVFFIGLFSWLIYGLYRID